MAEIVTTNNPNKVPEGKSAPVGDMKASIQTKETDSDALLKDLQSGIDRLPIHVLPVPPRCSLSGRQLCDWSVLRNKIDSSSVDWASIIKRETSKDTSLDRAVGCLLGMVAGDSVGAPLEFTPACSGLGKSSVTFDTTTNTFSYTNERNAFNLERGQWTDDASMGLCMAESMLAWGKYHGGDVRIRFHLWWYFGYCNAFRNDDSMRSSSVGLGGNIGQSLRNVVRGYTNQAADDVPGRYEATGEDAGNGSLMRLAPVPIRYHTNVNLAMDMAEESSYATHPGPDAANCCRFVAFFVCSAMHRDDSDMDIRTFTDQTIKAFIIKSRNRSAKLKTLLHLKPRSPKDNHLTKLQVLLHSKPPSPKEACWNWKAERLEIEETLSNRGQTFNGYPVSAEYFGSYCMDGLAMALWALTHSNTMAECILKTVNLCGDADTTASIAGQLAGSFYGYGSFLEDPSGQQMIQDIRKWDLIYELELRALLLHRDGVEGNTSHNK